MTQVDIADADVTKRTLELAQSCIKRQMGPQAGMHISRLQRMIDQIYVQESLEKEQDRPDDHIHGRECGQVDSGVWALGRYWEDPKKVSNNGKD